MIGQRSVAYSKRVAVHRLRPLPWSPPDTSICRADARTPVANGTDTTKKGQNALDVNNRDAEAFSLQPLHKTRVSGAVQVVALLRGQRLSTPTPGGPPDRLHVPSRWWRCCGSSGWAWCRRRSSTCSATAPWPRSWRRLVASATADLRYRCDVAASHTGGMGQSIGPDGGALDGERNCVRFDRVVVLCFGWLNVGCRAYWPVRCGDAQACV